MSPINPNFKPGVGHLVTDRYDFQKHVNGEDFRQAAGTVDLVPPVVLGSTSLTDVQTAIEALAGTIIVPSVPDATSSSKGIIQLNGDLLVPGSTAAAPKVGGLQGRPVSNTAPTDTYVLTWDASIPAWIPKPAPGALTFAGDLSGNSLTQTVTGIQGRPVINTAPTNGQALVWNSGTSKWTPTGIPTNPTGTGFATLTSGTYDAAATANIRYSGGKLQIDSGAGTVQFKNTAIFGDLTWTPTGTSKVLTLPDATDTLVGQATTDTLTNKTINATNNTITDTSAALGDILAIVSGTKFTRLAKGGNGTFLGVSGGVLGYFTPSGSTPSGTGFATVTGGVFDATATANIRYTGGKLQSDVAIQFKNGGITGDLTWAPSVTNKTLTLPNISDTLVGQTTSDLLTNKTISASSNTLTDAGTALGDLLKSNGTNFVRFARGTALQVLRTNSGATDLEWATVSFPATEVQISQSGAGQLNNVTTTDGSSNPAAVIRFTGDGAATDILLSGLVAPTNPSSASTIRKISLVATSTSRLILSNEDTNSTSSNRLHFFGASASQYIVGADGYAVDVVWDSTTLRWRVILGAQVV